MQKNDLHWKRYVTEKVCRAVKCLSPEGREMVEEVEGKEKSKKISQLWKVELCQVGILSSLIWS